VVWPALAEKGSSNQAMDCAFSLEAAAGQGNVKSLVLHLDGLHTRASVGEAMQLEMTTIKKWEPAKEGGDPEISAADQPAPTGLALRPIVTPGAAVATRMQPNHPLTVGLESSPAVLVEGSLVLKTTGDPRKDVLVALPEHPVIAGFAFPEAEERLAGSLLVGAENRGKGSVILFAHDPAFRLFWQATTPILLNAILYGPSAGLGGR